MPEESDDFNPPKPKVAYIKPMKLSWKNVTFGTLIGAIIIAILIVAASLVLPEPVQTPDFVASKKASPSAEVATTPTQKGETSQKLEVAQVHLRNLKYYIALDAEGFSQAFSENYIDWGSGPVDMDKDLIGKMFSEERFAHLKGKPPEEVVDLDKKIILGYSEILKSKVYESYEGKYGFHFQEGDVFISFPSKQKSLIPDGFSGVYRQENNVWKIKIAD